MRAGLRHRPRASGGSEETGRPQAAPEQVDVPLAWTAQAVPGARLVVPLRISGFTCEVTFERSRQAGGPAWTSTGSCLSGLIKMRGPGYHPEHDVPAVAGGQAVLRVEGGVRADPGALAQAAGAQPVHRWTGVRVAGRDLAALDGLEFWVASLGGLARLIKRRPGHGLAPSVWPGGGLAVLSSAGGAFAYLAGRASADGGGDEVGVCAYGPDAGPLASRVADRVREWAGGRQRLATSIEIYPLEAPVPFPGEALLVIPKEHVQVVVRSVRRPGDSSSAAG